MSCKNERNLKKLRHKEVFASLQKFTNEKITPTLIAETLGFKNADTIRRRSARNSEYSLEEIIKLDKKFNSNLYDEYLKNKKDIDYINENQKDFPKDFYADYYPDVFGSCGNGYFVPSVDKEQISIPKNLISVYSAGRKYSVINAVGESMLPSIHDGDKLIVEHFEIGDMVKDNRTYVFCYDNQIYVKRLIMNIDQLIIKSDNPDPIYKPRIIQGEEINNVDIIGRIVVLMRNMG